MLKRNRPLSHSVRAPISLLYNVSGGTAAGGGRRLYGRPVIKGSAAGVVNVPERNAFEDVTYTMKSFVAWNSSVPRQSVARQSSDALTVVDTPSCGMKL